MRNGDISDSLYCLGAACGGDLPDISYKRKLPKAGVKFQDLPEEDALRRPWHGDCSVHSFPQGWGHGSLGFGGMGTASMETAQVTVVMPSLLIAAVYYGRQLAYVITNLKRDVLYEDIRKQRIADCDEATRYGTVHSYGKSYVPKPVS